ncbi:MAG: hypothetical protein ACRC2T_18050 [Thermoguttaceae bacterium]
MLKTSVISKEKIVAKTNSANFQQESQKDVRIAEPRLIFHALLAYSETNRSAATDYCRDFSYTAPGTNCMFSNLGLAEDNQYLTLKNSGKEPTNWRRNTSREAHRPYRAPV